MNAFITPRTDHLSSPLFSSVYQPAEDSFLFLDALEKDWKTMEILKPVICVEMGCGSGIISKFVSENLSSPCIMMCIDINPSALLATRMTFQNKTGGISRPTDHEQIQSNLAECLLPAAQGTIDLILFNPPYVVTSSEEAHGDDVTTKAWAGGIDGRETMDQFFIQSAALLRPGGIMYLLCLKENRIDELMKCLEGYGFEVNVVISRRCRNENLFVLRCRKC